MTGPSVGNWNVSVAGRSAQGAMASSPPSMDPDEQSSAGARCATPLRRSVLRYGWASTPVRSRSERRRRRGRGRPHRSPRRATRWRVGGTRVVHGQGPRRRVWHRVRRSRRARTQGRARDVETVLSRELTRKNTPLPRPESADRRTYTSGIPRGITTQRSPSGTRRRSVLPTCGRWR